MLHVHGHAEVDGVVLQRPDQLEAGAVAHMREARVAMAAEVALQDAPVRRAIEDRAPRFELPDALRRLARVQLRHPPVVHVLAAAHRVGEVHLPVVAIVHVAHRRGDAALGHDRVGLAEQRLADEADRHAGGRRLDRRAQPGAAGADDEDVVGMRGVHRHQYQPQVGEHAHRAEPHVEVGAHHGEEAAPREQLVAAVQRADAGVGAIADRRLRHLVQPPADDVAQHVAAPRVAREQHDVDGQDDGAEADAEACHAGGRVGEPHRQPDVIGEKRDEDEGDPHEEAVDVLQDQRKRALAPVALCAARRRRTTADRPRTPCSRRRGSSSR